MLRASLILALLLLPSCSTPPPTTTDLVPSVAFESHRNLIFVPVFIGKDGPFNMMVDTGTDPSAVDVKLAERLGLKLTKDSEPTAGSGTEQRVSFGTSFPVLRVGAVEARDVEAATTDLSAISKVIGVQVDGVLGHSFLNGRVVQIDYPAKVLRFPKTVPPATSGKRTTIPFRWADDSILIDDVAINDRRVTALFDTGFNGSFNVLPAAIAPLGLQREFEAATPARSTGYNGPSTSRKGWVAKVSVGDLAVTSPPVTFWEPGTGHDSTSHSLTVGNGFLSAYVVTISYPDSLIVIDHAE